MWHTWEQRRKEDMEELEKKGSDKLGNSYVPINHLTGTFAREQNTGQKKRSGMGQKEEMPY